MGSYSCSRLLRPAIPGPFPIFNWVFAGIANMNATSSSARRIDFDEQGVLLVITHAGCIAAGMGRAFSRVCLSVCLFVRTLKGKRLELSTPNLVHVYSIAVARHALTIGQKVKSHGRTVASDHLYCLTPCAAVLPAAVAGVGLHVDTTACFQSYRLAKLVLRSQNLQP